MNIIFEDVLYVFILYMFANVRQYLMYMEDDDVVEIVLGMMFFIVTNHII